MKTVNDKFLIPGMDKLLDKQDDANILQQLIYEYSRQQSSAELNLQRLPSILRRHYNILHFIGGTYSVPKKGLYKTQGC